MKWINIKKKLPKDGQYVLIIVKMIIFEDKDDYKKGKIIIRYSYNYAQFRKEPYGSVFHHNEKNYPTKGLLSSVHVIYWAEIPKPKHLKHTPFVEDIIEKAYK